MKKVVLSFLVLLMMSSVAMAATKEPYVFDVKKHKVRYIIPERMVIMDRKKDDMIMYRSSVGKGLYQILTFRSSRNETLMDIAKASLASAAPQQDVLEVDTITEMDLAMEKADLLEISAILTKNRTLNVGVKRHRTDNTTIVYLHMADLRDPDRMVLYVDYCNIGLHSKFY